MLKSIHIENIAVIESADIEPINGFNALTGETGAGKSIIIDAINAVLGERTSKDIIRTGADKAQVYAVFGDFSKSVTEILGDNGIEPDDDGNVCIQRTLSRSSGSNVRINGIPVTTQILKEISGYLINIHGQHDSQMLLRPENHYIYLDLVADNQKERDAYTEAFKRFTEIRRRIKELETDEDKKYDRIDLLKFQISELEAADIKVGELEELKKTRELIENSEKILKSLNECVFLLNGDMESDGAVTLTSSALKFLEKAADPALSKTVTELSGASDTLYAIADTVRNYISDFPYSKEDAEKTDERLDTLHRMMLKYGNSEEAMLEFLEKAKAELEAIEMGDELLARLETELIEAEKNLVSAGDKLSSSRSRAAKSFSDALSDALPDDMIAFSSLTSAYTKSATSFTTRPSRWNSSNQKNAFEMR